MPGPKNTSQAGASDSSGSANFDESSYSDQSRSDLRELFTMIARLQAENTALRATAHLEAITERLTNQVERLEPPKPSSPPRPPLSCRLKRLADLAIDVPLDIREEDLSLKDLTILCVILDDDTRRAALISFASDSVTLPEYSFCLRSLGEGNKVGFLVNQEDRWPHCSIHGNSECTWMTRNNGMINIRREP
ncbi:hypothetical protein FBEOM_5917 [Fusarium beomiforme]|uniref:Uncharacterized protein n=1 Tax=Fusarium beomiforme TaxID=44412 RepID=A0A9P5AK43_9HYPO|nr:hypothetical protein FBEOM_5917 [Fusarium beomiforme]